MPQDVFSRLRDYYNKVAEVMRGGAGAASIFPNNPDIGTSREKVYIQFLRQHAPSKCNVFMGGFLFDEDGAESKQMDIIITTDTAPRFDFHNQDGQGKSFSPVEGTLCAVSIKSTLNKAELCEVLNNIASIPPTRPIDGRCNPLAKIRDYDDWPLKVIYASDGVLSETLFEHLNNFYIANANIPLNRRPNIIHVAGKYFIVRVQSGMSITERTTGTVTKLKEGQFQILTDSSDLQAIVCILDNLQQRASASGQIFFSYNYLTKKVLGVS